MKASPLNLINIYYHELLTSLQTSPLRIGNHSLMFSELLSDTWSKNHVKTHVTYFLLSKGMTCSSKNVVIALTYTISHTLVNTYTTWGCGLFSILVQSYPSFFFLYYFKLKNDKSKRHSFF
jgi:hypothetical protein